MEAYPGPEVVAEALDSDVVETRKQDPMVAVNLERIEAVIWVAVKQETVVANHL